MLSYIDNKDATLAEDRWTVKKIAAIAKHFNQLKMTGV